jgi:hypothetical protein
MTIKFNEILEEEIERINNSSIFMGDNRVKYEIDSYTIKNLLQLIILLDQRFVEIENRLFCMENKNA